MIPKIVITGAPASGKTEVWKRLQEETEFASFLFFEELARRLLEENPAYRENWQQFHLEIYRRQVAREDANPDRPFITDRGTVDAFAFHPETMLRVGTTLDREYRRYTGVIQLGSSAALGEEFYQQDNIRTETIGEVLAIEKSIRHVWARHPRYRFIPAEPNFEKKYLTCLTILREMIGKGK